MPQKNQTLGWGVKNSEGVEIWDAEPVFLNERVFFKDWLKLLFYPKKWFLYRWVLRSFRSAGEAERNLSEEKNVGNSENISESLDGGEKDSSSSFWGSLGMTRLLDVGCGTGADVIDFKKMFGRKVEVYGVEVVRLQVDLAREKIKKQGVWAEVKWYDGQELPFPDEYFDAVYTSDVLGHVADVQSWLAELNRVLKSGGVLAMFAESKLGRHAYIRNYLLKRGLNADPHAEYHISLYSKNILREYIEAAGFEIKKMYSAFWASFFVHPDEYHKSFDTNNTNHKFWILKNLNRLLFWIKRKLHPYSTALCELYGLLEMYLVGKWVEAQGYVILAKKR